MGLFVPKKQPGEDFPIRLDNAWAWDGPFWGAMSMNVIPHYDEEGLERARLSVIEKLRKIEDILENGIPMSERERKFLASPQWLQWLNLPAAIMIKLEPLNHLTFSENNLKGVRSHLRYLLVQITLLQEARGHPSEGIPAELQGPFIEKYRREISKTFKLAT